MARWLLVAVLLIAPAGLRAEDEAGRWLRQQARPVSVEATADDDLAVVVNAIGKSRVVLLGELTHGDGTVFAFKSRLVRYLHEHAGFEVLVWESGLMDCEDLDAGFAGNEAVAAVAATGLFGHWAFAAETQPLFEYVRSTHATARPLRQAGFDIQESGTNAGARYPTILEWLSEPGAAPDELVKKYRDTIHEAQQAAKQPDPAVALAGVRERLRALTTEARAEYEKRSRELVKRLGDEVYGFRRQCLKAATQEAQMMVLHERHQASKKGEDFIAGYNFRERCNAEHLRWLVNERYKGKKVVVWAHNMHTFAGLPDEGDASLREPTARQLDSMGRAVKAALKDDVYSIGFVAWSGTWSWLSNPEIKYEPAAEGGIEVALHALEQPALFIDLRPARGVPAMTRPMRGTINQQAPRVIETCWPRAYDGLVYLDEVTPRRAIRGKE